MRYAIEMAIHLGMQTGDLAFEWAGMLYCNNTTAVVIHETASY